MSSNPSAHESARRNLAQRIDRFLKAQILTDWQADQVLAATDRLDAGQFADGEHLMMKVERPDLWQPAGYTPAGRTDARQLLDRLQQVLAA